MNFINSTLSEWLNILKKDMPDIYMVGGSVRDYFLSKTPKDIDLVCHDAENTARKIAYARKAAFIPFLKKADDPCFRIVDRKNPENFIDFTPIHGDSIVDDLRRRDFSINAIAMQINPDGTPGNVIDPLNGIGDLEQKTIRLAGPAAFPADPLRILRAFRFAAALNFSIDPSTQESIRIHAKSLETVSSERIRYEFIEIFKTCRAAHFIRLMDELGVLDVLFPEILPMKICDQNGYHHLDVWNHSLQTLENCENILNNLPDYFNESANKISENLAPENRMPLLKIGAMFHDAGKPQHRDINLDKGRITFYCHAETSGRIMDEISERLRMSKQERGYLYTVVTEHMNILSLLRDVVKQTARMRWFRKLGDNAIPLIIHAMADIMAMKGADSTETFRKDQLCALQQMAGEYYSFIKPRIECRNLITGNDLIQLGMSPGPEMGKLLEKIREAQDAGMVNNRTEALTLVKELR